MKPVIVALGLVGLGGFSWASWHFLHEGVADQLTAQAQLAVETTGVEGVTVQFDHLDGVVSGAVPEKHDEVRATILDAIPIGRLVFETDSQSSVDPATELTDVVGTPATIDADNGDVGVDTRQLVAGGTVAAGALAAVANELNSRVDDDVAAATTVRQQLTEQPNEDLTELRTEQTSDLTTASTLPSESGARLPPQAGDLVEAGPDVAATNDDILAGELAPKIDSPEVIPNEASAFTELAASDQSLPQTSEDLNSNTAAQTPPDEPAIDTLVQSSLDTATDSLSALPDDGISQETGSATATSSLPDTPQTVDLNNATIAKGESDVRIVSPRDNDNTLDFAAGTPNSVAAAQLNPDSTSMLPDASLVTASPDNAITESTPLPAKVDDTPAADGLVFKPENAQTSTPPENIFTETNSLTADVLPPTNPLDSADVNAAAANQTNIAEAQSAARDAASTLSTDTKVKKKRIPPRLGIYMSSRQRDSLVRRVEVGSAAAEAGIRVGDRVISFGGASIAKFSDLVAAVKKHGAGDSVEVVFDRNGAKIASRVKLHAAPPKKPLSGSNNNNNNNAP